MSITRMVPVYGLVVAAVASVAIPLARPEDRKDGQKPTLWELDQSVLFPTLRQFVHAPGTKADRQFVPVEAQNNSAFLFAKVPDGWFTWKDGKSESRVIALNQNGFRILIRIERVPSVKQALLNHIEYGQGYRSVVLMDHRFTQSGDQVARVVECCKYKGDTNFMEYRYFPSEDGAVCVELTVFDEPKEKRTLEHLLAHLRSHYGKYEGVCEQVEAAVFPKR